MTLAKDIWKRAETGAKRSRLEVAYQHQANALKFPTFEMEYVFAPPRKWRFDFAWPSRMVAVEIEGGTWINGGHSRGSAFEKDAEKYNTAALLGWKVLRFTTNMVRDGRAADVTKKALFS